MREAPNPLRFEGSRCGDRKQQSSWLCWVFELTNANVSTGYSCVRSTPREQEEHSAPYERNLPGEHPYFPLDDAGLTADDVAAFWNKQDFNLTIPPKAGNCVFCFMKGTEILKQAANDGDPLRETGAPSDISWWVDVERRYQRQVPARNGQGISRFGFLGVSGPSFEQVADGTASRRSRYASGTPACDCTD